MSLCHTCIHVLVSYIYSCRCVIHVFMSRLLLYVYLIVEQFVYIQCVCMFVYMHVRWNMGRSGKDLRNHKRICALVYTHTHTHARTHTHTHPQTHTHIHSRTNTRTHNPPLSLSLPPTHTKVHWYGNCNKGNTKEATCCSNAALLKSGFDWTKFSRGNSCSGDKDLDRVLDKVPPPMCRERERDL